MRSEIYHYNGRLERYRRIIAGFGHNGEVALRLLDHLASLELLTAGISNVASPGIAARHRFLLISPFSR